MNKSGYRFQYALTFIMKMDGGVDVIDPHFLDLSTSWSQDSAVGIASGYRLDD
jgi:hypothetical protein